MEIRLYSFNDNRELAYLKMLECQSIIDENLSINGGPLKQEDLLLQLLDWQYLITANVDEKPIGLSLVIINIKIAIRKISNCCIP